MLSRRRFFSLLCGSAVGFGASTLWRVSTQASSPSPISSLSLPPRGKIRLVVTSDLNGRYGSTVYEPEVHQALRLIKAWQPDLVLCAGDMVAGQSKQLTNAQVSDMWQAFDQMMTQPLQQANIPFAFTLGNHDASGYQASPGIYPFDRDRQMAKAYWTSVKPMSALNFVDAAHYPFYYTFQQNGVFYLVLDATTASLSSNQFRWVEESLAQAQAFDFRIVMGHLPLYGVTERKNKPGEILNNADQLFTLLNRYQVHTYISGHHHAYYPGKKGELNFLHAGALGGGPRTVIGGQQLPYKSLTVLDIDPELALMKNTTINLKTMEVVDPQTLPSRITSLNGTIFRQL